MSLGGAWRRSNLTFFNSPAITQNRPLYRPENRQNGPLSTVKAKKNGLVQISQIPHDSSIFTALQNSFPEHFVLPLAFIILYMEHSKRSQEPGIYRFVGGWELGADLVRCTHAFHVNLRAFFVD
ncbi:MAG: hypothetical protein CEE38_20145 [Planctomycetes bacterium B3_Pla]|nr:MAG: hypothetical protein CEE38_20145 [Planctomycetes bacterium B3_Pla]